jgi:hypothetical protein
MIISTGVQLISLHIRLHSRPVAKLPCIPQSCRTEHPLDLRDDNRKSDEVLRVVVEARYSPRRQLQRRIRRSAGLPSARNRNTKSRPHPTTNRTDRCASCDASDPAARAVDHDTRDYGNRESPDEMARIVRFADHALVPEVDSGYVAALVVCVRAIAYLRASLRHFLAVALPLDRRRTQSR